MKLNLLVVALALSFCMNSVEAKSYKCRNEKGEVYFSDVYSAERCGAGGSELNAQGVGVKKIERIKSAEEIAAAKKLSSDIEAEKLVVAERQRRESILLDSYTTEADLKSAQMQRLDLLDSSIQTSKLNLRSREKSLGDMLASAAEAERAGRPVNKFLTDTIAKLRSDINEQQSQIERKQKDKATMEKQFEKDLMQYREIKSRQSSH